MAELATTALYQHPGDMLYEGQYYAFKTVIDAELDDALASGWYKTPKEALENSGNTGDEKATLLAEAKALGIDAKGTWGVEKLKAAIEEVKS